MRGLTEFFAWSIGVWLGLLEFLPFLEVGYRVELAV